MISDKMRDLDILNVSVVLPIKVLTNPRVNLAPIPKRWIHSEGLTAKQFIRGLGGSEVYEE